MTLMIEQDEAVEILGDSRKSLLRECLNAAWEVYDTSVRPLLPLCSPVGMANILRELVIQQVREQFVGIGGFDIRDRNVVGGRFLAIVDGRIILSFKKLTREFHTSNNETETSRAFDEQEPGLEGMPDLPRITVGYKLDTFGATMTGMYLAFVVGKECIWHHDLETGAGSIEFDFPTREESAAEEERAEEERKATEVQARRFHVQGTDDAAAPDIDMPNNDPELNDGG